MKTINDARKSFWQTVRDLLKRRKKGGYNSREKEPNHAEQLYTVHDAYIDAIREILFWWRQE
jgi:hypothetical protein